MLLVGGGDDRKLQGGANPPLISRRVNMPESSITLVRASKPPSTQPSSRSLRPPL